MHRDVANFLPSVTFWIYHTSNNWVERVHKREIASGFVGFMPIMMNKVVSTDQKQADRVEFELTRTYASILAGLLVTGGWRACSDVARSRQMLPVDAYLQLQ